MQTYVEWEIKDFKCAYTTNIINQGKYHINIFIIIADYNLFSLYYG